MCLFLFLSCNYNSRSIASQNPFYELEMPVRCSLFDINLDTLIERTTDNLRRKMREIGDQFA